MASKYFGGEDPIGKTISAPDIDYKVSAVLEDMPENSHFHFNFLAPLRRLDWIDSWTSYGALYTYTLLSPELEANDFEQKIQDFRNQYPVLPEIISSRVSLQPIENIHLHSHFDEIEVNNTVANLVILTTLASFILLLACINFINLSTARSAHRAREIGVRKVLGIDQIPACKTVHWRIGFHLLTCRAALAIALAKLFLPSFSLLVGKKMSNSSSVKTGKSSVCSLLWRYWWDLSQGFIPRSFYPGTSQLLF